MKNLPAISKSQPTQVQVDDMQKLHKHILALKRATAINFLDFGKTFARIRDEKLYEAMSCETFEEYLGSPEVAFDRSTVFAFMKIHKIFIEQHKTPPAQLVDVHWSKLAMIAPVVDDNNYKDMLDKAETLSRSELRKEVDSMKSHPDYNKTLFSDQDLVMDEIKAKCPIDRGGVCPFMRKYKNDILKEHQEKKKKAGGK